MHPARQCLDEILGLYRSSDRENTTELLDRVLDLYFLTVDQQSAADREAFGDVIARMAYSGDAVVRARLAERIAHAELVPAELLHRLARDEICVARPVLQYSPSLREGDLVSIAPEVGQDHLMATAHRHALTTPVTDILVQRGEPNVRVAVARNIGAEISPESLALLNEAAQDDREMERALHMRRDLAPHPIQRLKRLVETEFWQRLGESLLMTEVEAANEPPAQTAAEDAPEEEKAAPPEKKPADEPAMRRRKAVSEKVLVDAARAGEIEKTLLAFSGITRLDQGMIAHCLFEAHVSALMVLCKAHRLAPSTFTTLLQLRESRTRMPVTDAVGLMRRYEGMTPDTAQRIIRFSEKRRQNGQPDEQEPGTV